MKIVGLGAGGHASVMLDLITELPGNPFEVVGLLDADKSRRGLPFCGSTILGDDELLPELRSCGVEGFFIGLGSVGRLAGRRRLFELGEAAGLNPVTLVHPSAIIARSVTIGRGNCIMAGAILNSSARLGSNVCINTGAIIEHDCVVSNHAFISPGVVLAGGVHVGDAAFIGLRGVIRQGITVGAESIVGAGAVVVRDVPPRVTVIGVPARAVS